MSDSVSKERYHKTDEIIHILACCGQCGVNILGSGAFARDVGCVVGSIFLALGHSPGGIPMYVRSDFGLFGLLALMFSANSPSTGLSTESDPSLHMLAGTAATAALS
jgi:hypothetical protein